MKKGTKELAAAVAKLHEFLGDSYLEIMSCSGCRETCPVVAWFTQANVTEAVVMWDEPENLERVSGFAVGALVDEVCLRVIRRLQAVARN